MRNPAHLLTYPAWDVSLHDSGDHCYESSRCVLDALLVLTPLVLIAGIFFIGSLTPSNTGNGRGHLNL